MTAHKAMPQQTNSEDLFLQGQAHHQKGELDQALKHYRLALELKPGDQNILHATGLIALQQQRYADATDLLEQADNSKQQNILLKKDLATAYYFAGEYQACKTTCRKALKIEASNADLIYLLALALKKQKKYEESIDEFKKIVPVASTNGALLAEYADALSQNMQHADAINVASRALTLVNNNITAMTAFARSLYYSGNLMDAIKVYDKLIALEPGNVDHLLANAKACQTLGHFELARKLINKALKLKPDNAESRFLSSALANAEGDLDKALSEIEKAIEIEPKNGDYIGQKAKTLYITNQKAQALEIIKPLVENKKTFNTSHAILYINLSPEFGNKETAEKLIGYLAEMKQLGPLTLGPFYFAAAAYFDRTKQADKAFSFYQEANNLYPRDFSRETTETHYNYITGLFNRELYDSIEFNNDNNQPIFILGMPRSGTSLTEKILARHSDVTEMGELPFIGDLVGSISSQTQFSIEKSAELLKDENRLNELAEKYISRVNEKQSINTAHFTDKMPDNFLFLGLIKLIFPRAKIIHCNREAIDTCWSCYSNSFGAAGHGYSYDQDSLGFYYNYYLKVMQHWKQLFPDDYYELHYEKLVENPEQETRQLVEFCGLEWQDECLEHHKASTHTHTASYEQVRQPIYKTSKQKWKPYEKHLQPLIAALEKYKNIFEKLPE